MVFSDSVGGGETVARSIDRSTSSDSMASKDDAKGDAPSAPPAETKGDSTKLSTTSPSKENMSKVEVGDIAFELPHGEHAPWEEAEKRLADPADHELAEKYMCSLQARDAANPDEKGNGGQYKLIRTPDEVMAKIFGDGVSFWFVLLRVYAALFGLFILALGYFFHLTNQSNTENGTSNAELSSYARVSLGAVLFHQHEKSKGGAVTDADKDAALGIVMNDFICMFLVIGVTMYLYWLKDKLREKNDESMITMDDYTVKVYGLPQDVTEDRVRAHFGRFGEFHEIVFGRDLKELIDLRRKMLRLSPDKTKERAEVLAKINTAYSKNLRVVSCFVVYAEEEGRFACSGAVSKSVVAQFANKTKDSELAADDVRLFEGKHVLEITSADPPSDILWENLHYSRKNMPLRRAIMNILMAIFLVVQFGIIAYARDTSDQSLNPVPECSAIAAGGEFLDCTAIWDLTNQTLHAQAKEDIIPFIKRDVNRKVCNEFTMNGRWVVDMSPYEGFSIGNSSALNATEWRANQSAAETYLGGFEADTLADECAAHLCYACYCDTTFVAEKQGGGDKAKYGYNADPKNCRRKLQGHDGDNDGPGGPCGGGGGGRDGPDGGGGGGGPDFFGDANLEADICHEYDVDKNRSLASTIILAIVTSLMNNVIKTFAKVLSKFERAHSYSEMEKAVSSKLVVTLVINMVILPLLLSAKVGVLKWVPFLFEGDHRDFNRTWYEDFCNKFSQVAMVNSIMFPATSILPAVVWRVKRAVLGRYSKTQQQLNDVYKPPAYQLSERSAVYTAAIVYSLMFSSGIPLVYVYLIFMSLGFMVADRLMLLRYSQIPPRYTGKICALVLHAVPVAVLLHFLIAVYVFGERDLPSYTMDGTESGKWRHHGTKYVEDEQTDIGARLNRYNGFVPFMGFIIVSVMTIVLYSVLFILHRRKKRRGHDDENMEGCPPAAEAIAAGSVCGLLSYSITAHPDYLQVFPKDAPFSRGL